MIDKLPLDAKIALTAKMVDDLDFYFESKSSSCPSEQHFKIVSRDEDLSIERSARLAAFKDMNSDIKKIAFDTRRINQDTERNPRRNLQYWHRSEEFIDQESKDKIEVFDKLADIVNELKNDFESQPEWFDSYVRVLATNLDKVRIKKEGCEEVDVFKPHLSYLEQLIYNRYRYTLADIKAAPAREIKERLLSKDESLRYKGDFLQSIGNSVVSKKTGESGITNEHLLSIISALNNNNNNNNNQVQQPVNNIEVRQPPRDVLAELFGGNSFRRSGEKSVERTITINIVENVVE